MSYVPLGVGFSLEASTSGGIKTSSTGIPVKTVNVATNATATTTCGPGYQVAQHADGSSGCISDAEAARVRLANNMANAVAVADAKAKAKLALTRNIAKAIAQIEAQRQAAATQGGGVLVATQAGMSRDTKLLWAAGALVVGVAVVWALKRKPAKMAQNRKRMRRNAEPRVLKKWTTRGVPPKSMLKLWDDGDGTYSVRGYTHGQQDLAMTGRTLAEAKHDAERQVALARAYDGINYKESE